MNNLQDLTRNLYSSIENVKMKTPTSRDTIVKTIQDKAIAFSKESKESSKDGLYEFIKLVMTVARDQCATNEDKKNLVTQIYTCLSGFFPDIFPRDFDISEAIEVIYWSFKTFFSSELGKSCLKCTCFSK